MHIIIHLRNANLISSVFNTTGLRVVDASVIPGVVTGHPNAAIVMIGDMASSFIMEEHQRK